MFYKLISLLVVAIFVAMFAFLNQNVVDVNLVVWKLEKFPLALVILFSVLAGALVIGVFSFVEQVKLRLGISRLKQKIKELEEKVSFLEDTLKKQKNASTGEFLKDIYNY
jgi:uncharacterized integral membrane protein